MKLESATISAFKNKYHEDYIINQFMEFVWNTEYKTDAINNIQAILKSYDNRKRYTFKEKLEILFK